MGNVLRKNPYPVTYLGDPGSPGSPATPDYYTTETAQVPNGNTVPPGWTYVATVDPLTGAPGPAVLVPSDGSLSGLSTPPGTKTIQVLVHHPAQAAVPAVPGVDPVYQASAWDSGARSLGDLVGDGDFTCTIDGGVGGVSVGFATTVSQDPKAILCGVYCHNNLAQGFSNDGINPTVLSGSVSYTGADVWTVRRRQGVCTVLQNGTLRFTSAIPLVGSVMVQACLFSSYDALRSALITDRAGGSVTGRFREIRGVTGVSTKNRGVNAGTFRPLQGVISSRLRGSVTGSFQKLTGVMGNMRNYVQGTFRPLGAHIGNGGFIPTTPSHVWGSFLPLQGVIHGINGTTGQVNGSFRKLDALIGKAHQGKVTGTFPPMFGRISADPPGVKFIDSYAVMSTDMQASTLLVARIDSTGVMTDAWIVDVSAEGTYLDSTMEGAWEWALAQIDTVFIDSSGLAHDGMAPGSVYIPPGESGTSLGPLVAPGTAVWVLNVDTNASWRYENFAYTSFATREGHLYGTKADGVYLLEGDTDAGAKIPASFAMGTTSFADPKDLGKAGALKRIPAVYLGVASDKNMYLKVVSGGQEFLYISRTSNPTLAQQRVDTGRGLRSNYYSFEVFNMAGSNFDMESIEFIPIKLPRRIG